MTAIHLTNPMTKGTIVFYAWGSCCSCLCAVSIVWSMIAHAWKKNVKVVPLPLASVTPTVADLKIAK
jgi:hypothetical protein